MNLAQVISESTSLLGDKPAILLEDKVVSFREFDEQVRKAACWLRSVNLEVGDRVALFLPKSLDFIFLHFGVLSMGGVSLPLNPAYTAEEVRYFLEDSGSSLLIADLSGYRSLVPVTTQIPGLKIALVDAGGPDVLGPVRTEMEQTNFDDPRIYATSKDDTALLCYTSGTTGRPKGAMISHRNLISNMDALKQTWAWTEDDVLLHVLPLFHIHGLAVALHGSLNAGSTVVMHPRFDPVVAWKDVEEKGITIFMGVPTMYYRLLEGWEIVKPDLGVMRLFISGSAPLSESIFERFEEITGFRILERYGMTETGMITSNPLDPMRRKPKSVGYPLPGVSLRLVSEHGQDVTPGTVAEVWVQGENVFKGYFGDPRKTEEAFFRGWFRTGDLGYQDPQDDLRLYLVGRARDVIITGGFNVYPREVEAVLERHHLVGEAAVLGLPDEEFGEKVGAVVVPKDRRAKPPLEELLDLCHRYLARYKCPGRIVMADELPRNAMGKVEKRALLERLKT